MKTPLNVLIAEDSQDDADLILGQLRRAGFEPKWKRVETEEEFLAELKNSPDIILSDYSMPWFSGLRAAELTKKSGLGIPFILISGTVGEDVAVEAMKTGATDYLLKDRIARLGQAVERALREAKEHAQLKLAETQLRQLLEHSPAVIYSLKVEGEKIIPKVVSENITALLGFKVQEVLSYDWWLGQLHPEDREHAVANLSETLMLGTSFMEYRIRHQDGNYRWVEDKRRLIRNPSDKPEFIVGIWADITERKKAEGSMAQILQNEARRRKSQAFRDRLLLLLVAAIVFSLGYRFNLFVAPLRWILDHSDTIVDEIAGTLVFMCFAALFYSYRMLSATRAEVNAHRRAEEAIRILHDELDKQVQQRTMELKKTNNALQKEIAERKLMENALRESERRFSDMLGRIELVSLMLDRDAKITYCNDYLLRITGWQREEVLGRNWPEIFLPPEIRGQLNNFFSKLLLDQPAAWHYENEILTRAGARRLVRWNNSVLRSPSGEIIGTASIGEDVTENRKLEEQFRQSQKMESIGQLAGGVAHDFNNILAVIQMQAELLKISGSLSAEQAEFAEEIGTTVQCAAALTRQLLLFSRREVFQPRDLDLSESIISTTKMLKRVLGENVQIQLKLASQPMFIHADAGMMDQVLMNLCVNARDAMPNGGQLVIETSGVEFDEFAVIQSPQTRVGSFVRLSVSDSGCGIPPEIIAKIFEPFFTTKEVGKGTGLGLATVFGIVQQHQGWINVYSELNHGTTFRIYLPRLAKNGGPKSAQPGSIKLRGGNETILLVEDDPSLRVSVRKALSQLGYRILEAPTGVKALEVWKQNCDEIRLLLTDLVMPDGMTGKDLAQRLLQENPKLKVIYMSGYSAEIAGKDFPLKEGVNFLSKPFQGAKLAETIRASLD